VRTKRPVRPKRKSLEEVIQDGVELSQRTDRTVYVLYNKVSEHYWLTFTGASPVPTDAPDWERRAVIRPGDTVVQLLA